MAVTAIDTGTRELLCELQNRVATITLNRPEKRNALSDVLTPALRATLLELDTRSDVGCVVLTGAGTAFCAGGDLDHPTFTTDGMENRRPRVDHGYDLFRRIRRLPIPLIT